MITQPKERKLVSITEAEKIIKESETPEEAVNKLRNLPKRQPRPPAPEGGISLSAASRKYGVPHPTLSRWTKRGYIPVLLRTRKELYVKESALIEIIRIYKKDPGQGKKVLCSTHLLAGS